MRRLFGFLILLLLSVWLGLKISKDPGYALFVYQNWSVEMPLWFAILSMIILLFVFYMLMRLVENIDFSVYRWRHWRQGRKKYKFYSKTNRGLVKLVEGEWQTAEHDLTQNIAQADEPLINFLAAAKAAHEQGAYERRDTYLRKAHDRSPHEEIAIGLTQAQLQLEQGQLEQASATLERLRQIAPKHHVVLKLLEKVYIRLSDWQGLINILPSLNKAKLITSAQLQIFEAHAYQALLKATGNKHLGWLSIQQTWQFIPKKYQKQPHVLAAYVQLAVPFAEAAEAMEKLVAQALKKAFNKDLIRLYGVLKTNNPQEQLVHAEKWLSHYGSQPSLFLTLGRLSVRCQLWAKAKEYYVESLKLEESSEAYREYGNLLLELGELDAAAKNYRLGLALTSPALIS